MYNILICDDQKDIVNALKIYLTPEGYQLFTAYTGEEAVAIVKKENIHLILLDVMMPQMDASPPPPLSGNFPMCLSFCSPPSPKPRTRCWG